MSTLSHRMAVGIADRLNRYQRKEDLAYKKVVLGAEVILMNVSKTLVVIIASLILGVFHLSLLAVLGFNILRRTAFGVHAATSTGCTFSSVVMFVFIPFLLQGISASPLVVAAVFGFILTAIYLYAPMDTKARPIIGAKRRKRLKRTSIITCLILTAVLILIPFGEVRFMVMLGAIYSAIFILPLTYKILGREVNNYARFENN